jgi:hypothetical protein
MKPHLSLLCLLLLAGISLRASDFPISLKGIADKSLDDAASGDGAGGWTDEGPENSLNAFPTGSITFEGIPFEIPSSAPAVLALNPSFLPMGWNPHKT